MNWKALAITLSSVAAGAGIALAYNHGRGRGGMLGRVDIVDGKRHDGDTNALIRRGYREVPCASGLKNQARCWSKGKGLMGTPYEDAKAAVEQVEAEAKAAGAALRAFPRNAMGITPDRVKATPEWRAAKARSDQAFAQLQKLNASFTKRFAKEIRADRDARRAVKTVKLEGAADDDEDDAPDFGEDSWFDRLRAKLGAKRQGIRDAFKASPAIIVTQTDGRETLVIKTGEMQNPADGPERVTFFWKDGPVGHATRKTTEELIEEVSGYGSTARPATDAEVMAWTSTDEFTEGAARVAAVQRANAGLKGTLRLLPGVIVEPRRAWPQLTHGYGGRNVTIPDSRNLYTVQRAVDDARVAQKMQAIERGEALRVEVAQDAAGRLWILDGHHTLAAYRKLGRTPRAFLYAPGDEITPKAPQFSRGSGLGGIKNRDEINSHTMRAIGPELDEAERRAYAAGAKGDLEYVGAGMTGIVFCDERDKAFKVARRPLQNAQGANKPDSGAVAEEAAWLKAAASQPIAPHVARFFAYDRDNAVLVRECVRAAPRPRGANERKLHALHERISQTMKAKGWGRPEYKPDSYVYTRRGPVLVDAGFAAKHGHVLVNDTLDFLNGRRKLRGREKVADIAWELRMERGETIPAPVANKLLARLKAIDPNVEI